MVSEPLQEASVAVLYIGDLSATSLTGHPPYKVNPKYTRWAAALFEKF